MQASPITVADSTDTQVEPVDLFSWQRIIRRAPLRPNTKLLALMLATFADPDGSRIRPGIVRLASVTGLSTATVKRHLAVLRRHGLIVKARQGNRWARQADTLQLTVPEGLLDRLILLPPSELSPPVDNPVDSSPDVLPIAVGAESLGLTGERSGDHQVIHHQPLPTNYPHRDSGRSLTARARDVGSGDHPVFSSLRSEHRETG